MSSFEYAAVFYGIVVAMALETVASSFHKLMAAGARVRWHWMAPATAFNASLVTLGEFWILWQDRGSWHGGYMFYQFLPFAISLVFMFLSAAATLPDEVPEAGIDLQQYYYANRRHYWGLVVAFFVFNTLLTLTPLIRTGMHAGDWRAALPRLESDVFAIVLSAPMIFVRARWWHAIVIVLQTLFLLLFLGSLQIG